MPSTDRPTCNWKAVVLAILLPAPAILVTAIIIIYSAELEIPHLNGRVGDGSDGQVPTISPKDYEQNVSRNDTEMGVDVNKGDQGGLWDTYEGNQYIEMLKLYVKILNISNCYVCTHLPTDATHSLKYHVLPVSKYVGCVLMRDMLLSQHSMTVSVSLGVTSSDPNRNIGYSYTRRTTGPPPRPKKVPCTNMQPTKGDLEMLKGFDKTTRNEIWKGHASWDDIVAGTTGNMKVPRFRVGEVSAPSCILKDEGIPPKRVLAFPKGTSRTCSFPEILSKENWKDCLSFECTFEELRRGEQGLFDCEDRINKIRGILPAKTVQQIYMGSSSCNHTTRLTRVRSHDEPSPGLIGYRGLFFVCGPWAYFYLPPGWYGSCYLASIIPQMTHFTKLVPAEEKVLTHVRAKRTAAWVDNMLTGFGAMIPVVGNVYTSVRIHQLSRMIEDIADSTTDALGNITEELTSMRAVVIQNRIALDIILAKEGGVCSILHQASSKTQEEAKVQNQCCVFIPDNSGNIDKAIKKIKDIGDEAKGIHTGGLWEDMMTWFRDWGSWILKAIIIVVAALLTLCLLVQICPACCTVISNSCARCISRNGESSHHTHKDEDEGQEMMNRDGF